MKRQHCTVFFEPRLANNDIPGGAQVTDNAAHFAVHRLNTEADGSHTVNFDVAAICRSGRSVVVRGDGGDARALGEILRNEVVATASIQQHAQRDTRSRDSSTMQFAGSVSRNSF